MLFSCMWRIPYTFLKELKYQENVKCNTLGARISCKRFVFEFSLKVVCSCLWTTVFPVGIKNFHPTIKYFGKSLQVWPCAINILKILCINFLTSHIPWKWWATLTQIGVFIKQTIKCLLLNRLSFFWHLWNTFDIKHEFIIC